MPLNPRPRKSFSIGTRQAKRVRAKPKGQVWGTHEPVGLTTRLSCDQVSCPHGDTTLRRYAPQFLEVLKLRAAPAAKGVLDAIDVLRGMNADNARKVPAGAPTAFVKPRWARLVLTDEGIDRRYYELCALSELKNALRSGDVWVQGSRQFKDFEDYLVPAGKFAAMKLASQLPLAVDTDYDHYSLQSRLSLLERQLTTVVKL